MESVYSSYDFKKKPPLCLGWSSLLYQSAFPWRSGYHVLIARYCEGCGWLSILQIMGGIFLWSSRKLRLPSLDIWNAVPYPTVEIVYVVLVNCPQKGTVCVSVYIDRCDRQVGRSGPQDSRSQSLGPVNIFGCHSCCCVIRHSWS